MQLTMTKSMTLAHTRTTHAPAALLLSMSLALGLSLAVAGTTAHAQNYPITAGQKATADAVAQKGVPLSELAANAPDNYTVVSGDTLWGISGLFLKSPWRWPELWGMNMAEIKNPHLIYPGQRLFLEKKDGRATLSMRQPGDAPGGLNTVRVSPRTRSQSLADQVITTLKSQVIEAFLSEPVIVDEAGLTAAPRIVAAQEDRVLLSKGDRAYARGPVDNPVKLAATGRLPEFRVFRNATPLKDPVSGEVLGYEAQYVGKARLARGEATEESLDAKGKARTDIVPATIDIIGAKEEMRVGDRLLPEPPQQLTSYAPRAPAGKVDARIVSIYGSAVVNASQNQVVVINRGTKDGMEAGHVLAILKDGERLVDKTDASRTPLKLPDERNGLLMVFRTFDKLSYGLILDITSGVKIGDRLVNPR
jgi:hypothetical protein